MTEILFRLKYNRFMYRLIQFKPLSKVFKLDDLQYEKYEQKDSLQNIYTVFKILYDLLKQIIYVLFIALITLVSHKLAYGVWFVFLGFSVFLSNTLSYEEDMKVLYLSFKIPFDEIFKYRLNRRLLNRIIYAFVFPLSFGFITKNYDYVLFMILSIFFFFYLAESTPILSKSKKKLNNLNGMTFMFCLLFGFTTYANISPYYFILPMLVYVVFTFNIIRKEKLFMQLSDIFMTNIKEFTENNQTALQMQANQTAIDKSVKEGSDLKVIEKYKAYNLYQNIFLSRHKRLWLRPILIYVVIQSLIHIVFTAVLIIDQNNFFGWSFNISYYGFTSALVGIIIYTEYVFDVSEKLVRAYFRNGDYQLMHYAFYRRKGQIYIQFLIRLKNAFSFSVLPILVPLVFVSIWTYGFNMDPKIGWNYFVTIVFLSAFYNVHNLFVYYLIQPYYYNEEKPHMIMTVFNFLIYMVAFIDKTWLKYSHLGWVFLAIFILYVVIATVCIYAFGTKTFKYRD